MFRHWVLAVALTSVAPGAFAAPKKLNKIEPSVAADTYSRQQSVVTLQQAKPVTREIRDKELSVNTRSYPGYDALGIRSGDFIYYPSMTTEAYYNDNVYARNNGQMSDFFYAVSPELRVETDLPRHFLAAEANFEQGFFQKITAENYTDYGVNMEGRYDLAGRTNLPIALTYARDHSRRSSPDDRGGLEPTTITTAGGNLGFAHLGQTLNLQSSVQVINFQFGDTRTVNGTFNNEDRDRTQFSGYLSVGMPLEAYVAPFVYSGVKKTEYKFEIDDGGFQRSSDEIEFGAGSLFNLTGVLTSALSAGYATRELDDPRFPKIDALTFTANINWEPTTLLALNLVGKRGLEETTLRNFSASIDSSLELMGKYELYENLLIQPSANYLIKEYEGLRESEITQVSGALEMVYKLNNYVWPSLIYQYTDLKETENVTSFGGFESNLIGLSLKFQL